MLLRLRPMVNCVSEHPTEAAPVDGPTSGFTLAWSALIAPLVGAAVFWVLISVDGHKSGSPVAEAGAGLALAAGLAVWLCRGYAGRSVIGFALISTLMAPVMGVLIYLLLVVLFPTST